MTTTSTTATSRASTGISLNQRYQTCERVSVPASMVGRWGITSPEETLLIPSPEEVDQMMKRVPEGSLTPLPEIRAALAEEHQASVCCPLTTGIFAVIAAQASRASRAPATFSS